MFTGLLINRETVPVAFQWLHTISFFHAAFEALAVNELRYLQLKEVKYGVELDVPAATILSTFGLRAQVSLMMNQRLWCWCSYICCPVILVAEYLVAWHLFRLFHCYELCLVAFLREREAVELQ